MTVPEPTLPFDPLTETIAAGTVLFRVHSASRGGYAVRADSFNHGYGRATRFAFFGHPPVGVLYAADAPEGAVRESILHDVRPGGFVPSRDWTSKVLTALKIVEPIEVAAFHSAGASEYPRTVLWAEAAWDAGLSGVSYMCRHANTVRAVCLFAPPGQEGPRTGRVQALEHHPENRAFAIPADVEWLSDVAMRMRVTLGGI